MGTSLSMLEKHRGMELGSLNGEFANKVIRVEWTSDRQITVKMVCGGRIWNIVLAYAPQTV